MPGRNGGSSSPAPNSPAAPTCCASSYSSSSRRSRRSLSDTSLTVSPSSRSGTSLPTSLELRKPCTTRLHHSSARRSRIFHPDFYLPVSFRTSTYSVFCWDIHRALLEGVRPVWLWYRLHQHCGMVWFFVQWRYCQNRQCLVLSWYERWASLLVLPATAPSGF